MKISNKWWYRLKGITICSVFGHKYTTEIIENNQNWIDEPVRKRTYCKRCGKTREEIIRNKITKKH